MRAGRGTAAPPGPLDFLQGLERFAPGIQQVAEQIGAVANEVQQQAAAASAAHAAAARRQREPPPAPRPPPPEERPRAPASSGRSASSRAPPPELPKGAQLREALLEWSGPQLKEAALDCNLDRKGFLEKRDFAEALAAHLDSNSKAKREQITYCEICCSILPTTTFWPLACGHLPCEGCLSRYLGAEAEKMTRMGKRYEIPCMVPECSKSIPIKDAMQFYRHLSKLWKQLGERERLMREGRHRIVECPVPNCVGVAYAEPGRRKAMCFMCEHQWDVDPSGRDAPEDADFSQGVRTCPKCRAPIEKNGGCDHMQCSKCGRDFSWREANYANPGHGPPDASSRASGDNAQPDCCVQ